MKSILRKKCPRPFFCLYIEDFTSFKQIKTMIGTKGKRLFY